MDIPKDVSSIIYRYIHRFKLQKVHKQYDNIYRIHFNSSVNYFRSCGKYCGNCAIASYRDIRYKKCYENIYKMHVINKIEVAKLPINY